MSEIQRRISWAQRLLQIVEKQKGISGHDAVSDALVRLTKEGFLQVENIHQQVIYSLTDAGVQRLEHERLRQSAVLSQFVEDSALEGSFRRFLDGPTQN